jgi:hypothetical protein
MKVVQRFNGAAQVPSYRFWKKKSGGQMEELTAHKEGMRRILCALLPWSFYPGMQAVGDGTALHIYYYACVRLRIHDGRIIE